MATIPILVRTKTRTELLVKGYPENSRHLKETEKEKSEDEKRDKQEYGSP